MAALRARPRRWLSILPLEDRVTPVGELLHTLTPPSGPELFGTSAAASGQYVVVGAPNVTFGPGAVGVYNASTGALLYTLTSPTASNGDQFGASVAISGSLVVVGAPNDDTSGTDTGRAYVYDLSSGTPTTPSATLVNPDPYPSQSPVDGFGQAVAITGTTAWVAAPEDSEPAFLSGRVLEFNATTGANVPAGSIDAPSEAINRGFGGALAVSGNLLAVGAKTSGPTFEGKVYVYNTSGASPALQTTIDEPGTHGTQDWFGQAVAWDGTTLVVGAPLQDIGGNTDVGAAYVFNVPAAGGAATLRWTLNNPHPDNNQERFGHGVAIANGAVLVGSPYDDTNGQFNGQAYLFDATTGAEITRVANPQASGQADFGWSAAAAADKLVVGADFAGQAYTFQGLAPAGPPTVTINQGSTQADPTNSTSIKFDVAFSTSVTGFTGSDVSFAGSTAPGILTASVSGSGSTYTVSVTGMTGPGTVVASIPQGAATDSNNNGNQASTSTDNTVTFDNVPPDVTVNRDPGQADPTATSPITFDVHFTKSVTGFTGTDVSFAGSTDPNHLSAAVSGSGQDYTVTVTVLNGSAVPNTVVVSVPANAATDAAGNGNTASTGSDNSVTYGQVGTIQFGAAGYVVDENGGAIEIPVTRTPNSVTAVSVQYATADGTALAGTDYTAETGTLTWAATDSSPKTITVPITDGGVPEADKTFTVGLSNFSPGAAQGSPSATEVTIGGRSGLAFSAASYVTTVDQDNKGDGNAVITVHRLLGERGAVSVAYAASGGTATPTGPNADYTPQTGTLTWADGDTADKTFTVPIVDDTVSEGRETINLTLSGATGDAALGSQPTSVLTIAASDGFNAGIPFPDADGDIVTPKLSGLGGGLTYYLTNGTGPISEIDLAGTDAVKSTVSVVVMKPKGVISDGRVGIGEIDGTRVKSLSLAKADLVGAGIDMTGFVGSVTIGAVKNGADIHLNTSAETPPVLGQTTKITAGVIGDGTDISVGGTPLGSLTAVAIGQGSITAPSVGTISVKGKAKTMIAAAIPGDFESNLTVAGTGLALGVPALKSFRAAGSVSGAVLNVNGDVGSVSIGSFVNSDLFAGYTGPVTGDSRDFNLPSTVKSFTVRAATNGFENSYVIATNFKNVTLASVTDGGTTDGFVFHTSFGKLTVKNPAYTGIGTSQSPPNDLEVKKV